MATEDKLISAKAIKDHLSSYAGMFTDELGFAVSLEAVLRGIDFIAETDAVEVVHGRLIPSVAAVDCTCSVCRVEFDNILSKATERWNYCPNCGADMREGSVGE